jgi:hypothetical protein
MKWDLRQSSQKKILWVLIAVLVVVFALVAGFFLPPGVDWSSTFRPATLAVITGGNPYQLSNEAPYAGAPWGMILLAPFALLPEHIGRGFLFVGSLLAFAYAAYRLIGRRIVLIFFLLSPPVLHSLINANLDWIHLIGYTLPPWIGLFFLAVKPQMGIVVAVFWLVEAWRIGMWGGIMKTFSPVAIAFLISLVLYGFRPMNMLKVDEHTTWWNASLWPMSIPVGLALGVAAIRQRKIQFAMAASPCLSPHVVFHSWSAALIAIVSSTPKTIAAVVGLWILVIIRMVS